jgi:hypothetical protein
LGSKLDGKSKKYISNKYFGFGLVISKDNYMPLMGYPVRGSNPDSTTVYGDVQHRIAPVLR